MPAVARKNKKTTHAADSKVQHKSKLQPENSVVSGQLQKAISKKRKSRKFKPHRGVLFIKHLPHGFFEEQLKNYFKQFGALTRVRLARSTRSGNSKGFAFIEFAVPEVAQIAADTMNNYLMFRKIVKAAYIPPEKQRFNYFKSSVRCIQDKFGKSFYVSHLTRAVNKKTREVNKWTEENYVTRMRKSMSKFNKLKRRYADLGIDFDEYVIKPQVLSDAKVVEPDESTKTSNTKPAKLQSHALKEKMKDSARPNLQAKDIVHSKSKNLKRQVQRRGR